ncbi:Alpha-mannosidase [Aphelenchoides besseyi]|nr:Alpha-mannosidase [Aphelenchoides besseyi]
MWIRCILISFVLTVVNACSWDNCPKYTDDENINNIHLIAHTHDDMGWIKTVDDYFSGRNKRLVNVGVEYIFNTVIEELDRDPTKRFSFAEVGFLTRWLEGRAADGYQVKLFKKLVQNGQIEFIGGGWVQPDEAAAHYIDIVDQYALGLHKLLGNFGQCGIPKVAWQIDPFGHSREHANLVTMLGHEALFHGRVHYAELDERKKDKSLEYIWDTSDDLKANLFSGAFYSNNYAPPQDFCFDVLCFDEPVIDDPKIEGYNIKAMTDKFIQVLKNLTAVHRHNHYLLSMGSDFHFSDASVTFSSLDRLIKSVNQRTNETGFRVFYSTPSCYVSASMNGKNPPQLPKKSDDFFPYASSSHSYWTGYFTSKPALKRMVRASSNVLQLARSVRVMANLTGDKFDEAEEKLERALGLSQHHDAITGTSKENVTVDYEQRLQDGVNAVQHTLVKALQHLHHSGPANFQFCNLLNESICSVVGENSPIAVTVFNPNAQFMNTTLRLPFYSASAIVQDRNLHQINSEIYKRFHPPTQLLTEAQTAPYELAFAASLPPLGFQTYFVTKIRSRLGRPHLQRRVLKSNSEPPTIENEFVRLDFDSNSVLRKWTDKTNNKTFDFQQAFHYYTGFATGNQPSGAYVFRPEKTEPVHFGLPTHVEVVKGKTFEEIRQVFSPWISQRIRLEQNNPWATFDWLVGPIPKENKDPIGKEVISRFNVSGLNSNGQFFTDANGRQMMKRNINTSAAFQAEPIASNFYPVTTTIFVRDDDYQLTVLTDRSQGAGSFGSGNIDLMVHRRLFHDDHWGVDEALDEPGKDGRGLVISGKHLVRLSPPSSEYRYKAVELYNEPIFAFTPIKNVELFVQNRTTSFDGLLDSLPPEVRVMTFKLMADNRVLLRVENILQIAEGGSVVNLDLKRLFKNNFAISAIDEMSLAGNQQHTKVPVSGLIQIQPMQIRTFVLQISH